MNAYESTNHSYNSIRGNQRFINWNAQPSQFKSYPRFYTRILLEKLPFLSKIAAINAKKQLSKDEFYYLRINPSAGALYPNELYVQARGIDGLEDGIYHYDVKGSSLAFLAPISAAYGLEAFLSDNSKVEGYLFFVSSAYFRSSWKYGNRAIRYCFLDAGHLLGCIEASASLSDMAVKFVGDIDFDGANIFFGFENKESIVHAAIVGRRSETKIQKPPFELPFVLPYDYFERNSFVEDFVSIGADGNLISKHYKQKEGLENAILTRRSIRAFYGQNISKAEFDEISPCFYGEFVKAYFVVNRVEGVASGLYFGDKLLKDGDFSQKAGYLCLEQALGQDSAVTLFLLSNSNDTKSALLEAGLIAHRIYVTSNIFGIGVSGIGAYYDDEMAEFVGDNSKVLYAVALGR